MFYCFRNEISPSESVSSCCSLPSALNLLFTTKVKAKAGFCVCKMKTLDGIWCCSTQGKPHIVWLLHVLQPDSAAVRCVDSLSLSPWCYHWASVWVGWSRESEKCKQPFAYQSQEQDRCIVWEDIAVPGFTGSTGDSHLYWCWRHILPTAALRCLLQGTNNCFRMILVL